MDRYNKIYSIISTFFKGMVFVRKCLMEKFDPSAKVQWVGKTTFVVVDILIEYIT